MDLAFIRKMELFNRLLFPEKDFLIANVRLL